MRSSGSCSSRAARATTPALVGRLRDRALGADRGARSRSRASSATAIRSSTSDTLVVGGLPVRRDRRHAPGAARGAPRGRARLAVCNVVDASMAREADAVALHARRPRDRRRVDEDGARPDRRARGARAAPRPGARHDDRDRGRRRRSTGSPRSPELVRRSSKGADARARRGRAASTARDDFFFIGRHVGYPVALEGALKLKELSYLHAEGYPAGELKHGPIALIEPGTVVVAVITDRPARQGGEQHRRGARRAARASSSARRRRRGGRRPRRLVALRSRTPTPLPSPVLAIVPLQLLAYHLARLADLNVDRPRNLAKTVTVE